MLEKLAASLLKEGSVDAVQGVFPGAPVKPDPFLSNRILSRLGVSPDDCIFVGDSDVDFATAKNAGMTHVAVTWGFASEAHGESLPETHQKSIPCDSQKARSY